MAPAHDGGFRAGAGRGPDATSKKHPITLCTAQWADMPLAQLAAKAASWGYDGLELACWGDHLDVRRASESMAYCRGRMAILRQHGLSLFAICNALAGQLTCDPNNDLRSDGFAPADCRGAPDLKREWGIESMKRSAIAARNLGARVVTGLTGSPIWHLLYRFPPSVEDEIEAGFRTFGATWRPILDVFEASGVGFAMECHPTSVAYDWVTAERALEAAHRHPALGFNLDPSHLHWQGVDPAAFAGRFCGRILHTHMKDAAVAPDGRGSILGSHLNFGEPGRAWDFRSVGRGQIDFASILRVLTGSGYCGPLSVEWEDSGMEREQGARESLAHLRGVTSAGR